MRNGERKCVTEGCPLYLHDPYGFKGGKCFSCRERDLALAADVKAEEIKATMKRRSDDMVEAFRALSEALAEIVASDDDAELSYDWKVQKVPGGTSTSLHLRRFYRNPNGMELRLDVLERQADGTWDVYCDGSRVRSGLVTFALAQKYANKVAGATRRKR